MDLEKIGRYIAGKRKSLGLTQRELAEKLNMSDKSVSKWERGVCLPDVSVYGALCAALGITINEFPAGEDIVQTRIAQKSEENLMQVAVQAAAAAAEADHPSAAVHLRRRSGMDEYQPDSGEPTEECNYPGGAGQHRDEDRKNACRIGRSLSVPVHCNG